ncbi:hypothetical protein [Bradyrhizobium sp. SZCCHNR3118]|uniref:hypothetical protein n=1 Tax=Bradyrhizobium sp. SZCCHNR3118 TaxID=3057468 RepID=UPI0029160D77|nr:hypothetical protein [Bradyrhizobium sp. SZCCHNR3118]
MSYSNTRAQARPQDNAARAPTEFHQASTIELRARKLRQRFGLTPEYSRTIAALAFAMEARS